MKEVASLLLILYSALVHTFGVLVMLFGLSQPSQQDVLARARQFYNAQDFDNAIAAADDARKDPKLSDAAAVISARAHIERYRARTHDESDLAAARDALKGVNGATLAAADYDEFLVGLGESLYCDDNFGAAAELFGTALAHDEARDPATRERLFEWWAGALDHQAQLGPESDRKAIYERILTGAVGELGHRGRSAAAAYWAAAAARGADDLDRAWSAAVAGWVRAPSTIGSAATLRTDLDRLMMLAILPERARRLSPSSDPQPVLDELVEEWQRIKSRWTR